MSTCAALTMTLLTVSVAAPQSPAAGVTTADLYGHRLLLGQGGRPNLALGVTSGRDEVQLTSASTMRVVGRRPGEAAWTQVDLGARVTAQRVSGDAALQSFAVAVDTLEGADRSRREDVIAAWRLRGETSAFSRQVGIVFGIMGTVVDNRATLILVRPSDSRAQCEQAARELHQQHDVTTRVVPLVKELPRLRLRLEGSSASVDLEGTVLLTSRDGSPVHVNSIESETGRGKAAGYRRGYMGSIALAPDETGRVAVVNITAVDEVLKGVVPSEMYATAHLEALKAQAVTARGAVFAELGRRHFADPFTLCNKQHCQVYKGTSAYHPNSSKAVDQTSGELAFLAGDLVDSVYSSTCGGHTENAEVVWDTPPKAALRGRRDSDGATAELASATVPFEHGGLGEQRRVGEALSNETALRAFLSQPPRSFCARASVVRSDKLRWQRRISSRDMDRLMFSHGVGHVVRIEILGRGVSGRVRAVRIVGSRKPVVIQREWPVRQALGLLNSGAFVVDVESGPDGGVAAFVFSGAGWGHGVGMCQVGAIGMAEAGHDYRGILSHYYNGARVKRVY